MGFSPIARAATPRRRKGGTRETTPGDLSRGRGCPPVGMRLYSLLYPFRYATGAKCDDGTRRRGRGSGGSPPYLANDADGQGRRRPPGAMSLRPGSLFR